ncbi:MAG: hypothetical protein ACQES9_05125 [Myxococcota bacterium]
MKRFKRASLFVFLLLFASVSWGQTGSGAKNNKTEVNTQAAPIVNLRQKNPNRELYIGEVAELILTVDAAPNLSLNIPSRLDLGFRFQVKGEVVKNKKEVMDSGKVRHSWKIPVTSFVTDRLLDKKNERIMSRLKRRRADLNEIKTLKTEAKINGKDTSHFTTQIKKISQRIATDKKELNNLKSKYLLKPIPISFKNKEEEMGVVHSHEPGKGPRMIISSKLANEPDPKLKEPASEENIEAGGPFWDPYSIKAENTTLKQIIYAVLITLLVLAILLPLGLYLWKKRKTRPVEIKPRPAHEIAREKLNKLKSRGIPTVEECKMFAFDLSEIMREYFGNRYGFFSLEMTTTELLEKLETLEYLNLSSLEYTEFFNDLDLIKFAKVPLSPEDFSHYLDKGFEFIEKTWRLTPEEKAALNLDFENENNEDEKVQQKINDSVNDNNPEKSKSTELQTKQESKESPAAEETDTELKMKFNQDKSDPNTEQRVESENSQTTKHKTDNSDQDEKSSDNEPASDRDPWEPG